MRRVYHCLQRLYGGLRAGRARPSNTRTVPRDGRPEQLSAGYL